MKVKKKVSLWIIVGLVGLLLVGVTVLPGADSPPERVVLNIYNTAGFEGFYKGILIEAFEAAFPHIEVQYVVGKWPELFGKLKILCELGIMDRGETHLHLVILGGGIIHPFIEAGYLQNIIPYYEEKLPNVERLLDIGLHYIDVWGGYAVTSHIDYSPLLLRNPHFVPEPITTLDELKEWIIANPGRFMYGNPAVSGPGRGFVWAVAATLGEDPNHPEEWVKTWDFLRAISPYIKTYPPGTGPMIKKLAAGVIDITPLNWGWQADLRYHMAIPPDTAVDAEWTVMVHGDPHGFAIPRGAPAESVEAALKLINFLLSDEIQSRHIVHFPATLSGWEAMTDEDRARITKMMGGISFPEFLEMVEIRVLPPGDAAVRMFELWDEKIAIPHAFMGE